MMCLCRLHNYCIDGNKVECGRVDESHWRHLYREVVRCQAEEDGSATVVQLSRRGGWPDSLLDNGHHFLDAKHNQPADVSTQMDSMMLQVKEKNLQCPKRDQ